MKPHLLLSGIAAATAALATLGATPAHAQDPKFEYGKKEEAPKVVEWKAQAQAGAILTSGNSHTTTLAAGATASRKEGNNKLGLDLAAAYGKADLKIVSDANGDNMITRDEIQTAESTAPNNYLLKARYDRFLTDKNSVYATGRFGADKAAGKQTIFGGQVGYSRLLLKTGRHEFAGEFGYDFSYESFVTEGAESVAIHSARIFVGYTGALSADTGLTGAFELLTNVNEEPDAIADEMGTTGVDAFADNRITAKVGLTTKLTKDISFRFGFTAKYDQAPAQIAPFPVAFAPGFTPLAEELDTITDIGLIVNLI